MSSRRSSRRSTSSSSNSRSAIQPSVRRGLESLTIGNESYIATLLSIKVDTSSYNTEKHHVQHKLTDALEECMKVNNLSAEMLLAQFCDKSILSKYSENMLKKSGNGSASTLAARIAKEWSKPRFTAGGEDTSNQTVAKRSREKDDGDSDDITSSTKKRQVEPLGNQEVADDADVDDWRKPLFFWRGRLHQHTDQNKSTLRWKGSWTSDLAEHGLPPTNVFEETQSSSSFQLSGKTVSANTDHSAHHPFATLFGASGAFKGSYLLDQGDGQGARKFRDLTHRFAFATKPSRASAPSSSGVTTGIGSSDNRLLVAACGTTEFGSFVSAGFVRVISGNSENSSLSSEHSDTEMVLARRYIDENDRRNSWLNDAKLVMHACFEQVSPLFDHEEDEKSLWRKLLPRRL